MIIKAESGAPNLPENFSTDKKMEDNRLMMRGFASIEEDESQVRGGLSPETIRKIAKILGIIIDVISTYGEDFYKGYKKALEGKPLFALMR